MSPTRSATPSPSPSPSSFPSSSPSPSFPRPPGAEAPANREVPPFPPVRVRGGLYRLSPMGRSARGRRRALAVGLAVTAVALVAAGPRIGDPVRGHPSEGSGTGASARARSALRAPVPSARPTRKLSAPVRIADAAAVRLLRPGDRVDVIAAEQTARGATARVVARGALVTKVPELLDAPAGDPGPGSDAGALVVLSVPRSTAERLAGASASARLSVTLW
ncbi:RcpC/CpaB family pilus assembly protein [Streptomyces sp. AK04-3B]|uniref:RcpC/CpaB family pilus assembly protein n=1 Tax=Streptomyces sp. AK04-3B TaxID=3028650 RepID=UPI0029A7A855|nr:RcpC/CpaB family pilus assembly protein [Streptomyces sp. AK04-3B]MDX3803482.1 RcpC/CpaB family pilus assembly protein [Streptomyces sp. AK04-3B]